MKTLRRFFFNLPAMLALLSCSGNHDYIGLTLVPPGRVTDKVDLDIRAGLVNNGDADKTYNIYMYLGDDADENILLQESVSLKPGESYAGKYILDTDGMSGENEISLKNRKRKRTEAFGDTPVRGGEVRNTLNPSD